MMLTFYLGRHFGIVMFDVFSVQILLIFFTCTSKISFYSGCSYQSTSLLSYQSIEQAPSKRLTLSPVTDCRRRRPRRISSPRFAHRLCRHRIARSCALRTACPCRASHTTSLTRVRPKAYFCKPGSLSIVQPYGANFKSKTSMVAC